MAETILIDVEFDASKLNSQLDEATKKVLELEDAQKGLKSAFNDGAISAEDYSKQQKALGDRLSWAKKQQTDLIKAVQLGKTTNDDYGTSLDEQRRKLADMQKAYAALDADMRESKGGKKFREEIKAQSDAVKAAESAIGDNRRNVGNYAEALKEAGVGIDGFKKKLTALWKNPWAAIIGAIVVVMQKLIAAFKSSDARMRELQTAFAPLRAGIDVVKQGFDALAKLLSGVVQNALAGVASGIDWLAKQVDKLGKLFGRDWGISERLQEAKANTKALAEEQQKYVDEQNAFLVTSARLEKEISELRTKAAEKDTYSNKERIAFLEQAAAKEEEIYATKKRLAQENLSILQRQAAESENDAEANRALAEAEAAVILADKELADKKRELTAQIVEARNANKASELKLHQDTDKLLLERAKQQADALKKIQDAAAKEEENRQKEIIKEAEDLRSEFIKTTLQEQEQAQLESLERVWDEGLIGYEEYQRLQTEISQKYTDAREEQSRQSLENLNASIGEWGGQAIQAVAAINNAISAGEDRQLAEFEKANNQKKKDLEARLKSGLISQQYYDDQVAGMDAELEEKQKALDYEQAKRTKAINLMSATLNAAQAIIASLAQSPVAYGPIPNPVGIASLALATITGAAQIAAIAAEPLPQFERGGVVGGTSYTGDNVIARVNSGEGIYTTKQANNILQEVANNPARGGINYELLGQTMAAAVASQPAPVMDYTEFKSFGKKVSTYKEIAKI